MTNMFRCISFHCVLRLSSTHAPACVFLSRFSAVQKHTVEFNQLAMANSEGSEAMLNRVMTKDNIGVAVLLEVRKEMMEVSCELTTFSDLKYHSYYTARLFLFLLIINRLV